MELQVCCSQCARKRKPGLSPSPRPLEKVERRAIRDWISRPETRVHAHAHTLCAIGVGVGVGVGTRHADMAQMRQGMRDGLLSAFAGRAHTIGQRRLVA